MKTATRATALILAAVMGLSLTGLARAADSSSDDSGISHRLGGGAHYWRTLKQLKDDDSFDRDGVSYIGSYQMAIGWVKLEADVEVYPKNFRGSDKVSVQPMAYGLVGGIIYGGLGIGTVYTDDDTLDKKWSDPVMALRAGLDLPLLPFLRLDVNANYQFTEWANWDRFDTDTITLGAQARLAF